MSSQSPGDGADKSQATASNAARGATATDRTETVETGSSEARPSPHFLTTGTILAGRYELRSRLGTGGYAAVYRAWDRELRRLVAIKVLRPDRLSEKALRRFRREARVAQELSSPRLVRVYDLGRADDLVYMTMELVSGESLAARIVRCGALEIEEALRIVRQVLEALDVLHQRGIVHRDVKPSNILLDENDNVRLADLGLVLPLETDETRATAADTVIGTVEYLSPEHALGQDATARSDLYSVGVVLFEMLTGRVPHRAGSSLGTLVRSLTRPPANIRKLRADVPRWLDLFLRRLLDRDPAERPATARETLSDLEQRRAPLRRQLLALRGPLLVVTAALLVAAALAVAFRAGPSRDAGQFSHLVNVEGGGTRAIATDGTELWRSDELPSLRAATLARLEADGPPRLVGVLHNAVDPLPDQYRVLSVMQPETGEVLRSIELPTASSRFPDFADRYAAWVNALDLNEDGVDEILITYLHQPYWPSFTVLYEPILQRARVAFVASGHHYLADAVDLDRDGHKELLFVGINNRMGWMNAVAAIDLQPTVGETGDFAGFAHTPDRSDHRQWNLLHWYHLLGRGTCSPLPQCLQADEDRRVLYFGSGEERVALDFDGFPIGDPEDDTLPNRQDLRKRAYELLRDEQRLRSLGFTEQALASANEAVDAARSTGDEILTEWTSRIRARALVMAGRPKEALTSYETLVVESFDPSEVAFGAARSFHLAGELELAVRWYRTASRASSGERWGRGRAELLEGTVLALVEQRQWQEALLEIERYDRSFTGLGNQPDYYRQYVLWRRGGIPDPDLAPHNTDLPRYWALEFRLANGEVTTELLADVEAEMETASETMPMLSSLEAVLLERLGRTDEARDKAATALVEAMSRAETSTSVRAHLPLVRERASGGS